MSVGELIVMDITGDTKTVWNADRPEEVEAAKAQFDSLKKKGYIAYKVDKKGEKGEIMREFDSKAESVILSPPMRGG